MHKILQSDTVPYLARFSVFLHLATKTLTKGFQEDPCRVFLGTTRISIRVFSSSVVPTRNKKRETLGRVMKNTPS